MSEAILLSDAAPFFDDPEGDPFAAITDPLRAEFDAIEATVRQEIDAADKTKTPFALGILAHSEALDARHRDPDRTLVPSTQPYCTRWTPRDTGGQTVDDQSYNDYD